MKSRTGRTGWTDLRSDTCPGKRIVPTWTCRPLDRLDRFVRDTRVGGNRRKEKGHYNSKDLSNQSDLSTGALL